MFDAKTIARFRAKVDQRGADECWPWTPAFHRFHLSKSSGQSNAIEFRRYAWQLANGPFPEPDRHVYAECKNSDCANPAHLRCETIEERFWRQVDKNGEGGCWLWTGARVTAGYGQFRRGFKAREKVRPHRHSFELVHGPIPAVNADGVELIVCHRCDVPLCVNPEHLFLGTDADNCADKVAKGRQSKGPALAEAVRRGRENMKRACEKAMGASDE